MKHVKKLSLVFLAFVLFLAACGNGNGGNGGTEENGAEEEVTNGEEATNDGEGFTIGFSISTLGNPFFVSLRDGIVDAAEAEGIDVTVTDAQDDPARQVSDIEDLIQQGVDIIVINPTDSAAVTTAVEAANDAGIPVITVDRTADGGDIASFIASDNEAGGELAGQFILDAVGEGAKVAELEGIPGATAAGQRGDGFHNIADGNLDVVASLAANFDRAEGLTVMENILQSHSDIVAVFAHNDEMALGAIEAISARGLSDQIIVVGFDGTDDALAAIEAGDMAATVAQQPDVMGQKAVEAAQRLMAGETVEAEIAVPLKVIQ